MSAFGVKADIGHSDCTDLSKSIDFDQLLFSTAIAANVMVLVVVTQDG
jgi:hypothetical protein